MKIAWSKELQNDSHLVECTKVTPRDQIYYCLCCLPSRIVIPINKTIDGRKKDFYFAHESNAERKGSLETYQHEIAKRIIQAARSITLPGGGQKEYKDVKIEQYLNPLLKPDVIVDDTLAIEIWYTNKKSALHREKYKEAQLEAIEIDVREVQFDTPLEEIRDVVLRRTSTRSYIYMKPKSDHSIWYLIAAIVGSIWLCKWCRKWSRARRRRK
jgi:hypothetical protein